MTVHSPGTAQRWLTRALVGSALLVGIYAAYGQVLVPPPLYTPDHVMLATECCPWDAEARAWVDRNEDGLRQPGEPPLAGVAVRAVGFFDRYELRTDAAGAALFHVRGRCFDNEERAIVAEAPPGYRLTTPARSDPGGPYLFGFTSTVE